MVCQVRPLSDAVTALAELMASVAGLTVVVVTDGGCSTRTVPCGRRGINPAHISHWPCRMRVSTTSCLTSSAPVVRNVKVACAGRQVESALHETDKDHNTVSMTIKLWWKLLASGLLPDSRIVPPAPIRPAFQRCQQFQPLL